MRERRVPRNISTEPERPLSEIADEMMGLLVKGLNAGALADAARQKAEKPAQKAAK